MKNERGTTTSQWSKPGKGSFELADLDYALNKGEFGFATLRHNHFRNVTASLLDEVSKYMKVEPPLQPRTGESFPKSASTSDKARLDISTKLFRCVVNYE